MPLNTSGKISLAGSTAGESIAEELGQSATGNITLNDTNVRNLAQVASGEITMPTDFYGKQDTFYATIPSNQLQLNLRTWALANGWDGNKYAVITVGTGVYIYSNSTGVAGLTINGSWPNGVKLINRGRILGKGGGRAPSLYYSSAPSGGSAISLGVAVEIDNTYSAAYIGGGGGTGGGGNVNNTSYYRLGGCGAGAGGGNAAPGASGAIGTATLGGQGGRIIPGSGGSGGQGTYTGRGGGSGGGGTAAGRTVQSTGSHQNFIGCQCCYSMVTNYLGDYGGGGGGWGARGGYGRTHTNHHLGTSGNGGSSNAVGAHATSTGGVNVGFGNGGRAVQRNGYAVTWTNGSTARVYGAVS